MWRRMCRPHARDEGQGLPEYLGLVLIVATSLALGATLLPASPLPAQARNGVRAAVCKFSTDIGCDEYERLPGDGTATDSEGSTEDDSDDGDGGDEGDGGDDGGSLLGDMWDGATDFANGVSDEVGDLWDGTTELADDVWGGVTDVAGDVWDGITTAAEGLWWGIEQLGGVFWGAGEQLVDTVVGLWDAVTNPMETLQGIGQLFTNPGEAFPALWHGIVDPIVEDWQNGNYGQAIGRTLFSVAEVVVGSKGLTKLGKLGKVDPDRPDPDHPDGDRPDGDSDGNKDSDGEPDSDSTLPPAEVERRHALGEDPATGRHRPEEERAALDLERRLGRQLERDPTGKADWVDPQTGKTYDAVGSSLPEQHFDRQWQSGQLQHQVRRHLNEKADNVPIDVTNLNATQRAQVETWVRQQNNERIFIIGDD